MAIHRRITSAAVAYTTHLCLTCIPCLSVLHHGRSQRRFSSTTAPSMSVFNRSVKQAQRDAAALLSPSFDYLRDEVASRLVERLSDISRRFPLAVDLGCHTGNINRCLTPGQAGINTLIQLDMSPQMIVQAETQRHRQKETDRQVVSAVCDEEFLPLPPNSCDLILSSMSLHWVNDLPAVFSQVRQALKPDGVFLAAMCGGETLQELRSAFSLADRERDDTLRPHISPFVRGQDIGDLITAAGFTLPTVDTEAITVRYPDMFTLMHHLQSMGEQSARAVEAAAGRNTASAATFLSAASIYQQLYADSDGMIPATFQIYYIIGWAPHHSQPQPLRRGSAKHKLADLQNLLQQQQPQKESKPPDVT